MDLIKIGFNYKFIDKKKLKEIKHQYDEGQLFDLYDSDDRDENPHNKIENNDEDSDNNN